MSLEYESLNNLSRNSENMDDKFCSSYFHFLKFVWFRLAFFFFFFETEYHCIVQASLELTMLSRQSLNLLQSFCISKPSARITDID